MIFLIPGTVHLNPLTASTTSTVYCNVLYCIQMEGFVKDGLAKSIGVANFTKVSKH